MRFGGENRYENGIKHDKPVKEKAKQNARREEPAGRKFLVLRVKVSAKPQRLELSL